MIKRLKMIKDEVVNLMYLYPRERYSYVMNILVDKNNGRRYYLADDVYRLPGTVIKNKKKYLEANSVIIELIEDGITDIIDKYIPEYNFLGVILKSTVSQYRSLSEWLLEEDPVSAKFTNTGNTITNRLIAQVEDILNKFKNERRKIE